MNAVRLAAEKSAAIAKADEAADAKVQARIESGGRKPSYAPTAFEPVAKVWRTTGAIVRWQEWHRLGRA
jgi:hypothetical protein